jgi:hypothetical protein
MRHEERQKAVERKVHEAIDELSEEFDLEVSHYPEVYWIGRKLKFEDLGLPEKSRKDFNYARKRGNGSACLHSPRIIFIGTDHPHDIGEESMHFLHDCSAKTPPGFKYWLMDEEARGVISEALGIFGAKVLDPSIRNTFEDSLVWSMSMDPNIKGYPLGERLYQKYSTHQVSKQEIVDLLHMDFKRPGSARKVYRNLRSRLLN